jgi:naphthoate synthase/2-ketocyclohexanecarboxyl-CoA hydrolase
VDAGWTDIRVERGGARATITIDRPDRLNAVRARTLEELCRAMEGAADDPRVGVVVLTGAGDRAFCVGGDVREPSSTARDKRRFASLGQRFGEAIRTLGVPLILRVRGYCIGMGHEINVLADLTLSGTSGRFGQAGTRLGWAPTWWAAQRLAAIVGEKRAREIVYLSRQYTAEQALAMGLVNAVVPDEQLDAEVDRWCGQILRRSPQGLRLARLGLNASSDGARASILPHGEMHILNHLHGPEPREGMGAFGAGRAPDWRPFRGGAGPEPAEDPGTERRRPGPGQSTR